MSNIRESIMLKGIAQNILQMNVPKLDNLKEMIKEFGLNLITDEALNLLHKESREEEYTIFCKGLYDIEIGNSGFKKIPFAPGFSFKKMSSLQEAKNLAKTCCKWYRVNLNLNMKNINKTHISLDNDTRNSFIDGWEKDGKYWEVHYTPDWLK